MKVTTSAIAVLVGCFCSSASGFAVVGHSVSSVDSFSSNVKKGNNARFTTSTQLSANFLENLFGGMSQPSSGGSQFYTIGITGSTGLIGTALQDELKQCATINGKPIKVIRLSRAPEAGVYDAASEDDCIMLAWNPKGASSAEVIDAAALKDMDALVHLCGENISTGLGAGPLAALGVQAWSPAKKQEILDSRVVTTTALAQALTDSKSKLSFLTSSGIGIYGSDFFGTDAEAATESTDVTDTSGFLAEVSCQWEDAAKAAKSSGSRIVNLRTGVVMSKKGGALSKLYPLFLVGGGGNVGDGEQCFPAISARDMSRAIVHTIQTPSLKGPVNMCAPEVPTNAQFTKALGSVLNRPTLVPFPAFAAELMFGEMGKEVLLGGVKATPTKLLTSGFEFLHPTIEESLESAVNESI